MTSREFKSFSEQLDTIRNAPALTGNTIEQARDSLAEIRLREQALRTLKTDIKKHMQHIRQDYTVSRAKVRPVPFFKYRTTIAANARRNLTQHEVKDLDPFDQLTRDVDAAIQALEHTKLDINRWINTYKQPRHS